MNIFEGIRNSNKKSDDADIVVIDGVITRRYIARYLSLMTGGGRIMFDAKREEITHYLKIQNEQQ
jgi:hypothetical protein